ncbi:unnamed protein product [Hydatigera taeniaeformis]|uniref:Helicase ATP-binding domain-containing protein n=1 Tax=Hydatigena taeniaeformis TaxID=6205 RepID=A0A0R3WUX5_HYDTA|nr:unnamed protein product [Hydatigera taeniaeformis]
MSKVFGVDVEELASVFENKGTEEIQITPVRPKDSEEVDEEFEKKKRKEEHLESSKDSKLSSVLESTLSKAPRIKIYKIAALSTCTHEVAYPPGIPFKKLEVFSEPKILTFPFTLDPFQSQAMLCIDNNQSVMVSAHTSAGKTVIAEYAIAKALRDKQRVIYTTPIKALSNQKYREFSEEFPEVGLLTGDATININAGVLIMTTEILQSMLYRGSSIMREVGWVVFDEIHYMRDPERGVVWEESLVLLPDCVRFVFLSATTPNARQFAEWIAFLHAQPCHVVTTDTRPVPLRHYMYPIGGDGLYLVLNEVAGIQVDFRLPIRLARQ